MLNENLKLRLDNILNKPMIYGNREDMVARWIYHEERERYELVFRHAAAAFRVEDGIVLFLADLEKRIKAYDPMHTLPSVGATAPPSLTHASANEDVKGVVAYMGSSDPVEKCVIALMEDLDRLRNGLHVDAEVLKKKKLITDQVFKAETIKAKKAQVIVNALKAQ